MYNQYLIYVFYILSTCDHVQLSTQRSIQSHLPHPNLSFQLPYTIPYNLVPSCCRISLCLLTTLFDYPYIFRPVLAVYGYGSRKKFCACFRRNSKIHCLPFTVSWKIVRYVRTFCAIAYHAQRNFTSLLLQNLK